jgi:LacI family transcriptional regulator
MPNKINHKPTIKNVAEKANVSVATVSRVLNKKPGYSIDTENRVNKAIKDLNYKYNSIARNLKTNKTNTVAVLIPQVETTFYITLLNGIQDCAHKHHYNIIVCYVGIAGNRAQEYLNMLAERQVDGIIGCSLPPDEHVDKFMVNSGLPCLLVSTLSFNYDIPCIRVDDKKAEYMATEYLIRNGHRKIAILTGSDDDVVAGKLRLDGYKEALKDNNIEFKNELVKYTRFSFRTGIEAAEKLFLSGEKFTAIIACCDEVAIASTSVARKLGYNIPNDVSVIGYDNTLISKMCIPPLTTISQPLYEMGEKAFEMIWGNIEKQTPMKNVFMPFNIIERGSVEKI